MQPVRKRLAARRAIAGLAVANSRERNNADDRFLTGPKGAPQISQCCVAVLEKGMPFSANSALPWLIWGAPFGPARKRSSALLRSLELATASPAVVRLAANRFLTGCVLTCHAEGVPGTEKTPKDCYTFNPCPAIKHIYWVLSAAMFYNSG